MPATPCHWREVCRGLFCSKNELDTPTPHTHLCISRREFRPKACWGESLHRHFVVYLLHDDSQGEQANVLLCCPYFFIAFSLLSYPHALPSLVYRSNGGFHHMPADPHRRRSIRRSVGRLFEFVQVVHTEKLQVRVNVTESPAFLPTKKHTIRRKA